MAFRIIQFAAIILLFPGISCREPQKADLRAYFPGETLIYLETDDLSKISRVFTENKDWKSLSNSGAAYLSFLQNKQAALGLISLQNSEEGPVLQIKPALVLTIDTQAAETQAAATAEKALRELSAHFWDETGEIEKYKDEAGAERLRVSGSDGRKMFGAVSGSVILLGNDEDAVKKCLDAKQRGAADSLASSRELLQAKEERAAPEQIAFGYMSPAGIKEISDYLAVSYALKSSENSLTRGMISDILPEILQKTAGSVVWTSRMTESGVEDTYFVKTEKDFSRTVFQTVKAPAAENEGNARYLPDDVYSVNRYHLEDPQIAWRGLVLSLAARLDGKGLVLFEQFSRQLLKPYGIDDPEAFLSAVAPQIVTARFDGEGDEAVAIVKVKNKEKLQQTISETFDMRKRPENIAGAEVRKSNEGEFAAAFAGDDLIIGNTGRVLECLQRTGAGSAGPAGMPDAFSSPGAIVSSRQKDQSAIEVLSNLASRNGKTVEVNSYFFSEIRFEPWGIKRRTLSAFGLVGEMFKQTL